MTNPKQLVAAMVAHPILIERPIGNKDGTCARVGRPPENVDVASADEQPASG